MGKTHYSHIFFEHGYLVFIMNITGMKIAIHVAETRLEGSVSQNFDIGLSCFILCRK